MNHRILYQGHGSARITTKEGKVIYLDPYIGEGYDKTADLILVSHQHPDHNKVELIGNRAPDCRIITEKEAVVDGKYPVFQLGYVTVEGVQACNDKHPIDRSVGYILTFSDGVQVYFTCDTNETEQMKELAARKLDYAFYCSDGRANMSMEEASRCAKLVNARHSIPYHCCIGKLYDLEIASAFDGPGRILLEAGRELELE